MNSQKLEKLLNLALDSSEEKQEKRKKLHLYLARELLQNGMYVLDGAVRTVDIGN